MQKWLPLTFAAAVPVAVIAVIAAVRSGVFASRPRKGLVQLFDKKTRKRFEALGSAVQTIPPQLRSIVSKS